MDRNRREIAEEGRGEELVEHRLGSRRNREVLLGQARLKDDPGNLDVEVDEAKSLDLAFVQYREAGKTYLALSSWMQWKEWIRWGIRIHYRQRARQNEEVLDTQVVTRVPLVQRYKQRLEWNH